MSKFFKALEQAERERALREQVGQQQPQPDTVAPGAAATEREGPLLMASSKLAGQLSAPLDMERPSTERFHPRKSVQAPGSPVEDPGGVEEHLVSLLTPTSFEAEHYQVLRHIVEQKHKSANLHTIAITSPAAGDGKTITAINLAGALAQTAQVRVLLLEADSRRPSVTEHLGLGDFNGRDLMHAILDSTLSLEDVARTRPPFNFDVLPAGLHQSARYELLSSPQLGALLEEARQRYDHIIVDMPPLIPFSDCQLIGRHIDGFLIIVAAHKTPRRLVEEALNAVDPAKMIGFVFNSDDRPVFGYHRDYYDAYNQPLNGDRTWWPSRIVRGIESSLRRRRAPWSSEAQ
jgi:capsular exopolysaccharide synthesis family protein